MPIIKQKDIAEALKISRITVSKALRDYDDISAETKERVKKKAKELGYIPHSHASTFRSNVTKTIGVVVPNVYNSFFGNIIHGILERAKHYNYHIILTVSQENEKIEKENILSLLSMRIDGLLIAISRDSSDHSIFDTIAQTETPLVFFDRGVPKSRYPFVGIDDKAAAYQLVDYAINSGYRKIGHIGGGKSIPIGFQRKAGYLDALRKNSIPLESKWVMEGGFSEKDGYLGMKTIIEQNEIPEVIFTANDLIAKGVYRACEEADLKIPEDINIIGFGHNEYAMMMTPSLSIIDVSPSDIGQTSIDVIMNLISGEKNICVQNYIPFNLKINKSLKKKSN